MPERPLVEGVALELERVAYRATTPPVFRAEPVEECPVRSPVVQRPLHPLPSHHYHHHVVHAAAPAAGPADEERDLPSRELLESGPRPVPVVPPPEPSVALGAPSPPPPAPPPPRQRLRQPEPLLHLAEHPHRHEVHARVAAVRGLREHEGRRPRRHAVQVAPVPGRRGRRAPEVAPAGRPVGPREYPLAPAPGDAPVLPSPAGAGPRSSDLLCATQNPSPIATRVGPRVGPRE